MVATVFVENCHATAPLVTSVNIRCNDCEFKADEYVFAVKGTPNVKLEWVAAQTLLITHDESEVYRHENAWRDVSVIYRGKPNPVTKSYSGKAGGSDTARR